ncbi:MAG: hypothetical protein A4E26_00013 [Methanobacterium sp. PtaU1.Bin097]|nr:MAG: hypothetical protein A4E26_00013 [Methanobacterium sp. PtaU1.Bin097]
MLEAEVLEEEEEWAGEDKYKQPHNLLQNWKINIK